MIIDQIVEFKTPQLFLLVWEVTMLSTLQKKITDVSDISEMPNIYFDGNFFIILIPQ